MQSVDSTILWLVEVFGSPGLEKWKGRGSWRGGPEAWVGKGEDLKMHSEVRPVAVPPCGSQRCLELVLEWTGPSVVNGKDLGRHREVQPVAVLPCVGVGGVGSLGECGRNLGWWRSPLGWGDQPKAALEEVYWSRRVW